MHTRIRVLSRAFLALVVVAFSSACYESDEDTTPVATGMLKTREYLITLYTAPDGPLYSVQDLEGTVLEQDISMETMVARYPKLIWLQSDSTIEWAGLDGGVQLP